MSQKFKDNDDLQFYGIIVLVIITLFLSWLLIRMLIKAPDMATPEGKCRAFCAGIHKEYLGNDGAKVMTECFCDPVIIPPDKRLLRRP